LAVKITCESEVRAVNRRTGGRRRLWVVLWPAAAWLYGRRRPRRRRQTAWQIPSRTGVFSGYTGCNTLF